MDIEFLRKFCGLKSGQEWMSAPFDWQGYTYATNGHIIIQVPPVEGALSSVVPSPGFLEVMQSLMQEPAEWAPCPDIPEPPHRTCSLCGGTGTAFWCPECDEGFVRLATTYNDYGGCDCKSCDGTGQISMADIERIQRHSETPFEIIAMSCESCTNGTIYNDKSIPVGVSFFSDRYLSWLCQLPFCELGTTGPESLAVFRFVGGRGAIMPRRKDELEVVAGIGMKLLREVEVE